MASEASESFFVLLSSLLLSLSLSLSLLFLLSSQRRGGAYLLGGLGAVLGRPGRLLGGSWGALGRSKIDQQIDPKLDSKTGRIATEKNGPTTTPVVVSELEQAQRESDAGARKSYQNRFRYD